MRNDIDQVDTVTILPVGNIGFWSKPADLSLTSRQEQHVCQPQGGNTERLHFSCALDSGWQMHTHSTIGWIGELAIRRVCLKSRRDYRESRAV